MIRKLISRMLYPQVWAIRKCTICDGKTFNGVCPECINRKMGEE
jgi:hypothetical protein